VKFSSRYTDLMLSASLGPSASIPQTASCSVQPFLHSSQQKVPILYNWLPISLKHCPFPWDLDPHLAHGSFGPPKSTTQTASRVVQPFLQSSQSRQTDHATPSVTVGCIYVHSTRMRSTNSSLLTECRVRWMAVRVFFGERCRTSVTRVARSATTTRTVTSPFLRATAASIAD